MYVLLLFLKGLCYDHDAGKFPVEARLRIKAPVYNCSTAKSINHAMRSLCKASGQSNPKASGTIISKHSDDVNKLGSVCKHSLPHRQTEIFER